MSDESKPIPLVAGVQVVLFNGKGEPGPVATIYIDAAGKIQFDGDASKAYEPLLRATTKAGHKLARQSFSEVQQQPTGLRDDLDVSVPVPATPEAPTPLPAAGETF